MRIDKWLWAMRLYKTRSIAAEACKSNRISVNGSIVKAAKEVKVGDEVKVKKMPVIYSYKIIDLPKSRQGAANVPLFMRDITPQSEKDKLFQNVAVFVRRDRGLGRPTKKERREIDTLMGSSSEFDAYDEWNEELDSLDDIDFNDDDAFIDSDDSGYKSTNKKSSPIDDDDFDFNF